MLLGEGWVLGKDGARMSAAEALHAAGLAPLELAAKEGLALINGTDGMLGMLLLAIDDAAHLFTMADVTAALAIEAMLGSERPFLPELHAIRPHPGQAVSAANIHRLLQDSAIMDSHRDDLAHAVQDAYSMRCAPQVAGAARDTLDFVTRWPGGSCARWWTTRWCCPTAGSSRPATSTARRSVSPRTSWPSPPPRWARSPSGGWTGCST